MLSSCLHFWNRKLSEVYVATIQLTSMFTRGYGNVTISFPVNTCHVGEANAEYHKKKKKVVKNSKDEHVFQPNLKFKA